MFKSFNNLRRYEKHLLRGMAFSIPISIGLTQVFFFSFIALALPNFRKSMELKALKPLRSQLICWLAVMVIASCASVSFFRSMDETIKFASYPLFIISVLYFLESIETSNEKISEIYKILLFLFIGQTTACLVTVISLAAGLNETFGLPGPVTESGQLALVLPVIVGIILEARSKKIISNQRVLSGVMFLGFVLLISARQMAFQYCLPIQIFSVVLIGLILKELLFFQHLKFFWRATYAQASIFALSLLPVLMAAFVFNLKRGPWLGVMFAIIFLGMILGRKKIVFGVVAVGLSMLLLPPVRTRLLNLVTDFTIAGGRERMWGLGVEIASRFPLGVGPKNAVYMRVLDPYLPPTHRHLHNNILNVVVEMGYLGGVIFIWWMVTLVFLGFKWAKLAVTVKDPSVRRVALLAVSISAAILSWQCAGLVEYNFGDAEIKMLTFLLMGLLLGLNSYLEQSSNDVQKESD